ncbi:MAG: hypothetical protein AAGM38_08790 [Pseudomonadota bacterium]
MRIFTVAAIALLTVMGCAAQQKPPVAQSSVSSRSAGAPAVSESHGVVALSIASDPEPVSSLLFGEQKQRSRYSTTLIVENIETRARFEFSQDYNLTRALTFGLVDGDDFKGGRVYAHRLPVGSYHITDFEVLWATGSQFGTISRTWTSAVPLSIPFDVAPQSVSYLGEWRCLPQGSEGFLGTTEAVGCLFAISDRFDRDAPLLNARFTNIDWSGLMNSTMRSGEAPPGLITFR